MSYPFSIQFLFNLHESQNRINRKFIVLIPIHYGKMNLTIGRTVQIFCYQLFLREE